MISLPQFYFTYGLSDLRIQICDILNERGYLHISGHREDRAKSSEFFRNQVFIITILKHSYPFFSYSPIEVYSILDMPERHVIYSEKELQNLVDMFYCNDEDSVHLSLSIFSKMNIDYILEYKENIRDAFNNTCLGTGTIRRDPYLMMLTNYVNLETHPQRKFKV